MGSTPFPSEVGIFCSSRGAPLTVAQLINPAPRSSILAALMHPHEYSRAVLGSHDADPERTRLWDLPDTSIVFRRYLDAGRMINVHDWFESFQQILDARREAARGDPAPDAAPEPDVDSPTGRAGRKVAVKQGREVSPTTSAAVSEEEEEEASRVEIQARFVRALHELDFLGFIKHTKRKADHIIKTVFELPDQ
jgi:origin recognition complex subunit 3